MTGPAKPTPEPSSSTPAAKPPAGSGEGAQTALIELIRKRKLRGEPEVPGDVPQAPPAPASEP